MVFISWILLYILVNFCYGDFRVVLADVLIFQKLDIGMRYEILLYL